MIVAHFSGFASIPRSVSKNPNNFPASTPNTHFSGFSFNLYLAMVVNMMEEDQAPTQRRAKHQDILGQLQGPWLRGLMRIGTLLMMVEKLTSTCSKRSKIKQSIVFKFLSK